jgi:carboxylesterase type B
VPGWPEERRNFALWDIQRGLEWIQQNIVKKQWGKINTFFLSQFQVHFGGHKAHVTVMARGNGARMVELLGTMPQGKGQQILHQF